MIIKSSRMLASNSVINATIKHVFDGKDNDNIEVLQGNDYDVHRSCLVAKAFKSKYATRHIKIAPQEDMTDEQAMQLIGMYCDEFGANKDNAVIVKHTKDRADSTVSKHHYHVYLPEVMEDKNYRIMDTKYSKIREEKISRLAEIKFNHKPVIGKFNKSVIKQLRDAGLNKEADIIKANTPENANIESTFTSKNYLIAKRNGESINYIRQQMKDIKNRPDINTFGKMLNAVNEAGYDVRKGDKENTYILVNKGSVNNKNYIGSASRFFGMQKNDFNKAYEEFTTNNIDTNLFTLKDSFAVKSSDKQFKPEKKESVKQERQGTSQVGNTNKSNPIKASNDIPTGHFSGNKESLKSADNATQAEKEYANFVNSENAKIVESSAISEETRKKLNAIFEQNLTQIFHIFSNALGLEPKHILSNRSYHNKVLEIADKYKDRAINVRDIYNIKQTDLYQKSINWRKSKVDKSTVNSETSINDKDSADNTDDTPMYIYGMGKNENKEEMDRRLNKNNHEDDIINKLLNRPRNTASDDKGNSGINPNHNDKNASKAASVARKRKNDYGLG